MVPAGLTELLVLLREEKQPSRKSFFQLFKRAAASFAEHKGEVPRSVDVCVSEKGPKRSLLCLLFALQVKQASKTRRRTLESRA